MNDETPSTVPVTGIEESILNALSSPNSLVGIVCLLLIVTGLIALRGLKAESPLAPYILQIMGLTFILPVVILITVLIKVDGQAVMGLLGTIVGYIFGTSRLAESDFKSAQGRSPKAIQHDEPEKQKSTDKAG